MTTHRLKHFLERNDGGCWGEDPTGIGDTVVLRSTEQSANGDWRINDPAARNISLSERKSKTINLDDIIITKSSGSADHIGKASIADQSVADLEAVYSNFMQRIRVNSRASARYVWHLLNSSFARYHYNVYATSTSGLGNLNGGIIGDLPFPVPDLSTQREIADFLDRETARIDLLIEKKQKLVALLGEKAKSVINQATTIGFRACETQETGETWLGEIAAHWRITPLKWFVRLQSGFAFKADRFGDLGIRLVRMNNLKRGALDLGDAVYIAHEDVNTSVMLSAGDIILGMSGSIGETGSLGNFAVVAAEDLPCLLNQRVGRFQFVGDELLPDYLKLVIQSASFLDPIFLAATSTAQFNVSPSQVGAIMFALPPFSEQQNLVDEVARRNVGFKQAREQTLLSIDRLKEYRSALITAAVTGQIDVTTYAKSGATDRRLDAIQEEMGA